jgi:hypothetical protein
MLAGKGVLGGAVVGLAAVSVQAETWSNSGNVATVSTDKLGSSLLDLVDKGKAGGAIVDLLNVKNARFGTSLDTSTDVMDRFGSLAQGAFSMGWQDIIGRAQNGTDRVDDFNRITGQLDTTLANLVRNGHGVEAKQIFDQLMSSTHLTGDELQHVKNRFLQYAAAQGTAERQSEATTRAVGDQNSVLVGVQHGGNVATKALHGVADAEDAATAAARRHKQATQADLDAMDKASQGVLDLRQADRELARPATTSRRLCKATGRGMNLDTGGRPREQPTLSTGSRRPPGTTSRPTATRTSRCAGSRSGSGSPESP